MSRKFRKMNNKNKWSKTTRRCTRWRMPKSCKHKTYKKWRSKKPLNNWSSSWHKTISSSKNAQYTPRPNTSRKNIKSITIPLNIDMSLTSMSSPSPYKICMTTTLGMTSRWSEGYVGIWWVSFCCMRGLFGGFFWGKGPRGLCLGLFWSKVQWMWRLSPLMTKIWNTIP